jgi:HKD family nuclease
MKVIQNKWLDNFLKDLKNTKDLKLISPFITDNMVTHLLKNWHGNTIQVITRFNLNDFRSGVSSLKALKRLIENGAEIKGIKNLHSKAYIFDSRSMIITSANFTNGGFFTNYELGIKSESEDQIKEALHYFNKLWIFDESLLDLDKIIEWQKIISQNKITIVVPKLKDYGTSIVKKVIGNKKHFVKFYGTSEYRAEWDWEIKDLVKDTHCHFALTFPSEIGRPKRYNDGDVVYMAHMMNDGEYAIFGKAIAYKHDRIRDVASEEDIRLIPWKSHYNIYIRIHSPEFLDSTFSSCPRMGVMMNELGYESFRSTKERHDSGEENINPRLTLKQKPDVELSEEGAFWVEQRFIKSKNKFSLVPQTFIDGLYQGTPKI